MDVGLEQVVSYQTAAKLYQCQKPLATWEQPGNNFQLELLDREPLERVHHVRGVE
jgi:hypothetical protein